MPTADVNGARLSYESLGEGTPLLFIHGGYGGAASTLVPLPNVMRTVLPRERIRTIVNDRRNRDPESRGLRSRMARLVSTPFRDRANYA
jgi:pimeloyl-ACP methyl ester carboxylesterase